MHVEVQEQVMGIGSFLLPCEMWRWNSGLATGIPFTCDPSCQPSLRYLVIGVKTKVRKRSQMLVLDAYPPPLAVRLPDHSFQHSITESIIWCPLGHSAYNKHFTYTFSFMFMQ